LKPDCSPEAALRANAKLFGWNTKILSFYMCVRIYIAFFSFMNGIILCHKDEKKKHWELTVNTVNNLFA